ncbi:DUF3828 domain-containing protein [Patescibacteria group bacterium]|nr:DUF3828 domain-containing protein [Patescibacteria group bacterium]
MNKRWLGILLLLIIMGAGYYLYTKNSNQIYQVAPQNINPAPTTTNTSFQESDDKKAIIETANSFYQKYDSCMKNPPAEAKDRVGEYCQGNLGLTTTNFVGNLEKGGTAKAGADPVVCAQNFPENITVSQDIQINTDQAKVSVNEKFGPTQVTPQIELLKKDGVWKIDNIVCVVP